MKKRIGSVILTLAMMLTLFPAAAVPARAEGAEPHAHSHYIKAVNTETDEITETAINGDWTALDMNNVASHYTLTGGNYYLTENLELETSTLKVSSGEVNLCLNGYNITSKHAGTDSYGAIYLTGGTLNIFDDSETPGVIQNTSEETFGGWGIYVNGNSTTLKLHGGTIKGGIRHGVQLNSGSFYMFGGTITDSESGVYVGDSANLYMAGGSITGNKADDGGGVYNSGGSFTMTGGTISDNTATGSGGGVFLSSDGTFTMKGGKISRNTLDSDMVNIYGGGVYVSGGTFEMSGSSEISENTVSAARASTAGGGIYVNASGTVTIKDNASVKDNTAKSDINSKYAEGGGIYIDKSSKSQGKVTIQDNASVTGNKAVNSEASDKTHGGGVYVAGAVSGKGLYISGSPKITGNKSESSAGTTNDNVYLYSSALINVADALSGGASIGVKMAGGTGTFTGGYSTHNSGTEPDTYFFSDAGNEITLQSNEAYLTANPAHVHDGITFKAWTATDALPTTAGNYYLTDNVTLVETWSVPDGTTNLCLNGKQIALDESAETGSVIYVGSDATLNLYDESGNAGKITGGKGEVLDIGFAAYAYGGGVYNVGTFTMSGGAISGNSADYGGGVYNAESGTFNMSGGAISNNTSVRDGGGVYNYGSGTFNMSGGEISNNTSKSYTSGGVRFFSGTMTVSGTARITDNKSLDSNSSNIYLSAGRTLNVGTLEDGASIGVSLTVIPGSNNVANPYPITGPTDGSACKDYFFSDIDSPLYKIEATDDGKVAVAYYCTVTFDMNGHGNAIDNQSVYNGGKFTEPAAPTEDGYAFGGWYTSATYQTAWDFDSTVSEPSVKFAAKTLYAKWTETPAVAPTVTAANVTMTYGDSDKSVSVTATPAEGHTITGYQWYSNTTNSNEGGKPISGATESAYALTGMDAGTYYYYCVVTTKRTDNDQTTTATSNAATVTVNRKDISLGNCSYHFPTLIYDGTEQTIHFETLQIGNDDVTEGVDYTLSGNTTGKDAGEYKGLTFTGIGNYMGTRSFALGWTIYKREATLTWSNTTFTYDGAEKCPTATVSNLVDGDTCAVTVTGAQTNAGTYTATATELDNSNYRLPSTTYNPNANSKSFTIGQKEATLNWDQLNFTYDGAEKCPTATVSNLVNSDTCTVTVTGGITNAGSGTARATALSNPNYKLPSANSISFSVVKASQAAPTAPKLASATVNSITLSAQSGEGATEYAKNTVNTLPSDGWQTSPTFTGLTQNTEYYFFTRFNGNGNYKAATSTGANFSTSNHEHHWTFNVENGVISAVCDGEGDCDLNNDGGSVTLTAPTENLVYNTETHNASVSGELKTGDTVTVKYEYKVAADGSYAETNTTVNAGYYKASVTLDTDKTISVEYAVAKAAPDYTEPTTPQSATYGDTLGSLELPTGFAWNDGGDESVGNVGNNSFTATLTPNDTVNYNTVQKTIIVNVSALPETIISAGDVTTDYINETIGGFANGTYIITADGDSAEIEVTDGTVPVDNNYYGKDITIVKKAADANHANSNPLAISISARPSKPSDIEVTKATDDDAANGKITGVDAAMEYKAADDEAWTQVDGNEITGLLKGTYYVRVAPTNNAFASEAVTAVIGVMDKVTVVFIDGDGNTLDTQIVAPYTTVTYDGDTPTKTATAQFTYVFTGWDKEVGLVTEDTTFTAQFDEHLRSHSVTLNTNGGNIMGDFTSYTYGTGLRLPIAEQIVKDGYTFIGWYDNAEFEGEAVTEIAADETGNKEYFARWKLNGTTTSEVVDNNGSSARVEVENLERIAEELSENIEGDVEVVLEITKENADSESAEQAAIEAIKTTNTVEYYDISLLVNTEKQATAPENISIKIPYDTTRVNITVYRYDAAAASKAVTLSAEDTDGEYYEISDGYITIHTSSFATYAIGYDAPAATAAPRHSSGGSSRSKATPTPSPSATPTPEEIEAPESTATPTPTEEPSDWWYIDVPETTWYYAPIKEALDNNRMSGMSDDYFEPETDITRGMFAYAIYRREGLPETDSVNKFEDIKAATYYETAIAWATENGIVAGYDDTHYGPDDQITREQMAAILWRYAKFKEYDVSVGEDTNILDFTDALDISKYAIPAIQWAVGDSVITGFEDGTMRPHANANRAQMAVILNKIADLF